ncbi:hypothetical protein MPTK1_1g03300 [Marchantia polymorpha subsp. ruderalis]|uniref:EF-hand domain-containing protein n=2 Tax=Marchantia polymorpha TaxID=3197 RepID=A0A176WQD5_MARPO|nr:hypothetical protein AXG93_4491s1180 [Marchantia polymorpha subsp. ruderalis]PTQ48669.1 hypothetical protein MARPO_0005s0277 [Marchantia polymorpha]BBM97136.1 hypothetical protein Mp_1g03300 [Marchantia polymorpha subsp. ruderalis]|eukprot:PTQ48669.1 hypothetical protein MARPO_0005s0277 [Marchantia polymorpha]
MDAHRICTFRRSILTYFFLSLVVVCHARVPSSPSITEKDEGFSEEGSGLRLVSSSSSENSFWQSKWEAIKSPFVGAAELEECEENYGIFPCSTTAGGNLFLLLVYGFCLLKAAQCLSEGSELLLTVLNPGLIGGLLLPILGAMPDALLILVSGLSASQEDAQAQVLVGMGLLAGSTIMLLTLLWGSSLILGRCDLVEAYGGRVVAKDRTLTKGWSLTETGVTTDQQTRVSSWIMMVTVLPYLVAQSPVIFGWSAEAGRIAVLVGCAMSLIGLASYCTYQVAFPWIQQRWIYRAMQKVHRSHVLHRMSSYAHKNTLGSLLQEDGRTPNTTVLYRLFDQFDVNNDRHLSREEVRGLIVGLGIESGLVPNEEVVKDWMKELDINENGKMSQEEFVTGMKKWIASFNLPREKPKRVVKASEPSSAETETPHLFFHNQREEAQNSYAALLSDQHEEEDEEEEEGSHPPTKGQIIFHAVLYLMAGAAIAGIMADPLVGAIGNFSKTTGISPFFISFVATPMATNSSEAISSLLFALKKKKKNISMTYSQIYGGVTMNNTMCLAIFLAVVYYRGLTWDFSSEVLVILVATVVIGVLASVRVTFPFWMALIALALYPISVAMVAILDYVYGWQ